MAARCFKIEGATDVLMAEAYAARDGVYFAQQMGHFRIILKSDNEHVISTLSTGGFSATASSAIPHDCMLHASAFDQVSYEFCPREANLAAHEVARLFTVVPTFVLGLMNPLISLQSLINNVNLLYIV